MGPGSLRPSYSTPAACVRARSHRFPAILAPVLDPASYQEGPRFPEGRDGGNLPLLGRHQLQRPMEEPRPTCNSAHDLDGLSVGQVERRLQFIGDGVLVLAGKEQE